MAELSPGTSLSHYRIVGKIGEGGIGEVYRAQDTELGRPVALKLLSREVIAHQNRQDRRLPLFRDEGHCSDQRFPISSSDRD